MKVILFEEKRRGDGSGFFARANKLKNSFAAQVKEMNMTNCKRVLTTGSYVHVQTYTQTQTQTQALPLT